MPSTTTNPHPDVPGPAGAVFGDAWEGEPAERVIMGQNRGITDTDVVIWTSAIQFADGRIQQDEVGASEPPLVHVDGDVDLNSDQARELAAVLLEITAELDRGAAR